MKTPVDLSELLGKRFISVTEDRDEMVFLEENGDVYRFFHDHEGCDNVYIESIIGDLNDLIYSPLLSAYKSTEQSLEDPFDTFDEYYTWTYYTFITTKGRVEVNWWGSSDGSCDESISLVKETR